MITMSNTWNRMQILHLFTVLKIISERSRPKKNEVSTTDFRWICIRSAGCFLDNSCIIIRTACSSNRFFFWLSDIQCSIVVSQVIFFFQPLSVFISTFIFLDLSLLNESFYDRHSCIFNRRESNWGYIIITKLHININSDSPITLHWYTIRRSNEDYWGFTHDSWNSYTVW